MLAKSVIRSTSNKAPVSIQQIQQYVILRKLGQGGMGQVFLARDDKKNRLVAIKLLSTEVPRTKRFYKQFAQEVNILTSLQHPAIVPVFGQGMFRGMPYLVMRYMEGGTLRSQLKNGALPHTTALRITRRIGSALDYAHARGIIHRDIKPANVLFNGKGQAFLADFGIARLTDLTTTVTISGTPKYMAPEQVAGKRQTGRTDIYQLGLLLFEMLSGRSPYYAETPMALMYKHVNAPVPDVRSLRPSLPSQYSLPITQALAKTPSERPATARAFITQITKQQTPTLPLWRWAAAAIFALAMFIFFLPDSPTESTSSFTIMSSPNIVEQSIMLDMAISNDNQRIALANDLGVITIRDLDGREVSRWPAHMDSATAIAWVGNEQLVSASISGEVKLWQVSTRDELWNHQLNEIVLDIATSPDQQTLSIGLDTQLESLLLIDVSNGLSVTPTGFVSNEAVNIVAWSPDGQLILAGDDGGFIKLWNADTGELEQNILASPLAEIYSATWIDNQTIGVGAGNGQISIWPTVQPTTTPLSSITVARVNEPILSLDWSISNEALVAATGQAAYLWDIASQNLLTISELDMFAVDDLQQQILGSTVNGFVEPLTIP